MKEQGSWFECPICYLIFNNEERKPMIICMAQHTVCKICIEDMFKGKDKQRDQILCYLCRKPVFYNDVTPFYWLNELNATKESLKREGSNVKKALKLNINELEKEVIKEREKNEWLMQLFEQTKLKNTQTQEALEELMTYQMNQMKKMLKEERKQQSIEIIRLFQTCQAQTKESMKKQANLRREESLKTTKQQQRNLMNVIKNRFDTLQTENKDLTKQFTLIKLIFHDFEQNVTKTLRSIQRGVKSMNEKMQQMGKCDDSDLQHQKSKEQQQQTKEEWPTKKNIDLKEQKEDQKIDIKEQKKSKVAVKQSKESANVPLKKQTIKPSGLLKKIESCDLLLTEKSQDSTCEERKAKMKEEKQINSEKQLIKSKPLPTQPLKKQPAGIAYLPPKTSLANILSKQANCKKGKEMRSPLGSNSKKKNTICITLIVTLHYQQQNQSQKIKDNSTSAQLRKKPRFSRSKSKDQSYSYSKEKLNRSCSMKNIVMNRNIKLTDQIKYQQNKFKSLAKLLQSIVDDQGLSISKSKIEQFIEEHIHQQEDQILLYFYQYKENK